MDIAHHGKIGGRLFYTILYGITECQTVMFLPNSVHIMIGG